MSDARGTDVSGEAPPGLASAWPLVPPGLWVVDPEASVVGFSVRHLAVATVHGRFTRFEGWVEADESGDTRTGGSVEAASLDTGMDARDARLLSDDCFAVERHPEIRFEAAVAAGGERPELAGYLTIMGRTRPVRLRVDSRRVGADNVRIVAGGVIRRRDFGLRWSDVLEAGGAIVSDRVTIRLDVSAGRC